MPFVVISDSKNKHNDNNNNGYIVRPTRTSPKRLQVPKNIHFQEPTYATRTHARTHARTRTHAHTHARTHAQGNGAEEKV